MLGDLSYYLPLHKSDSESRNQEGNNAQDVGINKQEVHL